MADRAYLSIGEVLSLLTPEFPDVTISKIRFLESQGLIDPERTPSGYRKFYEGDVERLRWILRQQRENFLPLKVIRGRLGDGEEPLETVDASGATTGSRANVVAVSPTPDPETTELQNERRRPTHQSPSPASDRPRPRRAPVAPSAAPAPSLTSSTPSVGHDPDDDRSGGDDVALTADELAEDTGLDPVRIAELQKYGLISARTVGGTEYFDTDARKVAEAAAGFLRHGLEARHLRPFRSAAEREAGLFEQIVLPMLKQRNPVARRQAAESLAELAELGLQLRGALLRQALRDLTG